MRLVAALALVSAVAACRKPGPPAVTGTATYRERMALPPDAVFEAALVDISQPGGRAKVLTMVLTGGPGQPPIPFRLRYDPRQVDTSHQYAVRARISAGGRVLFVTDSPAPVLTRGHPPSTELVLRRVGGDSATAR